MSDLGQTLRRAKAWSDAGLGVALATVLGTWGSAPRRPGSLLAVSSRGELEGSVSGGCVEAAVAHEALAALRDGKARVLEYGVTDERAWEVGLACGGTVRVVIERAPVPPALLARLAADDEAGRPAVVAVDLATGEAALLHPGEPAEGAGEDPALVVAAREAVARDLSGEATVGGRRLFLRVHGPPVRVVMVGAVHIAQALAAMAAQAGYAPTVVDPRRAFATEARFAGVTLVRAWPEEALAGLRLDRRTAVVTLSHDPKLDDPALAAALRSEAFYVGALGSRKNQAARLARLSALGLGPADLARVHGPAGLDLGARTPGEIAASILAEIVGALRRPAGRALPSLDQ